MTDRGVAHGDKYVAVLLLTPDIVVDDGGLSYIDGFDLVQFLRHN